MSLAGEPGSHRGTMVLSSQRVVTPRGERAATLTVQNGRIAKIEDYNASQGIDFGSVAILPALVDVHVHLNEPGRTSWEGFETGTTAAAAGGNGLIVDMPLNSDPVTTSVEALQRKREAARGKLACNVGFHGGLVPGNEAEIEPMLDAGVLGIKAFLCHSGIDEFPAATERELRAAMPILAERGIPLLVHAELERPAPPMIFPRRYADYLATRPPSFERTAIELLIRLCRETNCRTHIVHLADCESVSLVRAAKDAGLPLTAETCPHYLYFNAEAIADGACEFKCAPPIRSRENAEGLWQALVDGTIDFVASDHSPCPPEMKSLDTGRFDAAWGGISSVQLTASVMWTLASKRGVDLSHLVRWLSQAPAQFLGLRAGIEVGQDADLIVFDAESEFEVRGADLHHRHPITPYNRETLRGLVKQTFLQGVAAAPGVGRVL